jgi:hypothetical protein
MFRIEEIDNIDPELKEAFKQARADTTMKIGVIGSKDQIKQCVQMCNREQIWYTCTDTLDLLTLRINKGILVWLALEFESLTFYNTRHEIRKIVSETVLSPAGKGVIR